MEVLAFKMMLCIGQAEEYKKRHDFIWPELKSLLKDYGISDYSIFLDEESHVLFAKMTVENASTLTSLPESPLMKKWWAYMKDIMVTNEDASPLSIPLTQVFFME
ncbi:L-rhamnose mutarotase [Bacteroidota bacterium]|nr:L-rhamnose mutarotase [Bacteroidota bacterium]